jgi:ATPase subunit of ABC transporter with duplicated ATPase domains
VPAPTRSSNPATLVLRGVHVDQGGRTVLDDVSLTVAPSACIGVVGPNGVGKSTLLRVLAGVTTPDAGERRVDPPGATIGLLAQEHPRGSETVRQMLTRRTGVAAVEEELEAAAHALASGEPGADDRYADAVERHQSLGAGTLDARIEVVAGELGIGDVVDRSVATVSGGQAAKAALAAIVLSQFDITLLDEPTNDLDFEGLDRLEALVRGRLAGGQTGSIVLVSHDRDFLSSTITSVVELDEHHRTARVFGGGWDAFLAERVTLRRHAEEEHARYASRRDALVSRARRERDWATQGVRREKADRDGDKMQRGFRMNRTEQLASRARRTERALRALAPVEKPWEPWELRFTIGQAERAGAVVVRLERAVVDRGTFRLGPIDVEIDWGDRVALTGPNGSGKSTMVAAIAGRLELTAGRRWLGPSVVIGELGQDRQALATDEPIDRVVQSRCGLTRSETRSLLAKFGLGADDLGRPSATLSPGERTRAELATFQGLGVNFLILDEPTNHLDLQAIEQLEAALDRYEGTLLLVSHDRRLLDTVDLHRTIELAPSHA